MTRRAEFTRLRRGKRVSTPSFLLQFDRFRDDTEIARVGITVTKKIGNAVVRNRAKRRLREAYRQLFPELARRGFDYVLIARPGIITRPYDRLLDDLRRALVDPRHNS